MKNNSLIITVVIAVLVGTAGFYAGTQYQKNQRPDFGNRQMQNSPGGINGGQGMQRGKTGYQPAAGEITSIDDTTITLKTPNGSSKIVIFSGATKIQKMAEASKADLKTGKQITVFGITNSDQTIIAESISLGTVGSQK